MKFCKFLLACATISAIVPKTWAIDVTKSQYDLACTGANTSETILTQANVNPATFGKLFSKPVDGQVYAQPLYLQNVSIGGGIHNVVFICTEHNSVYAFDADNESALAYWHRTLPTSVTNVSGCNDLVPEVGITATPVIDRNVGALYVEASTYENGVYYNKLYAINLADGNDVVAPATISASAAGSGTGSSGGHITFDSFLQFCRPGLLLLNGKIYFGSGAHCDIGNYHGWLLAYNANNLSQAAFKCITPNGSEGSIWQYGGGLSSDGSNIFCVTGNGSNSSSTGDYGESVLKFDANLNLVSSFTPYNFSSLDGNDQDLSSSVLLIPGSNSCTAQGKSGSIYVMDQTNLGGFNSTSDNILQRFDNAYVNCDGANAVPVFWDGLFYLWSGNDHLRAYSFNGSTLNTTPQSFNNINQGGRAGSISLSANGNSNGILWGTNSATGDFYALLASNVSTMLWNDGQAANSRDVLGSGVQKYARPIVANGKVYVPTVNSLVVYGLLKTSGTNRIFDKTGSFSSVQAHIVKKNVLALEFPRSGDFSVSIIDMRGKVRAGFAGYTNGIRIDKDLAPFCLTPGAYLVKVDFHTGDPAVADIIME
jgi:hypothetical protein